MIKLIAQKSLKLEWFYQMIFNNIPIKHTVDLELLLQIIRSNILQEAIEGNLSESRSDSIDVYTGNPAFGDDYYIAFYDASLDLLYEDKYDIKGIVYDENRLMLKFSEKNFKEILNSWKHIYQKKPLYLIITQDDDGWIDMQGKQELDEEEKILVQRYQNHQEELKKEEIQRALNRNKHLNT